MGGISQFTKQEQVPYLPRTYNGVQIFLSVMFENERMFEESRSRTFPIIRIIEYLNIQNHLTIQVNESFNLSNCSFRTEVFWLRSGRTWAQFVSIQWEREHTFIVWRENESRTVNRSGTPLANFKSLLRICNFSGRFQKWWISYSKPQLPSSNVSKRVFFLTFPAPAPEDGRNAVAWRGIVDSQFLQICQNWISINRQNSRLPFLNATSIKLSRMDLQCFEFQMRRTKILFSTLRFISIIKIHIGVHL